MFNQLPLEILFLFLFSNLEIVNHLTIEKVLKLTKELFTLSSLGGFWGRVFLVTEP